MWERSDAEVRQSEGLEPRKGLIWGREVTAPAVFEEDGLRFVSDVIGGHKTGFYLDQRASRASVAAWVRRSRAARVLDAFAYTGAFSVCALRAGASQVVALDSAHTVRDLALQHVTMNGLPFERFRFEVTDAFRGLREMHARGERFDLIILDPPRLAPRRHQVEKALRAYKDVNLSACRMLNAGGLLVTFCCSGLVERELFGKVIEGAARDAGRRMRVVESLFQPPDHPILLGFSESEYLKGFVLMAE